MRGRWADISRRPLLSKNAGAVVVLAVHVRQGVILRMALFLSTFKNKIDKKGRVSVPATFRNALKGQNFHGIIAYPSFINPCVEACSFERISKMSDNIETLDPFSEERDAFATAILGGSQQLNFDGEGRVMLPELLLEEDLMQTFWLSLF